jgi:hypothetical protein
MVVVVVVVCVCVYACMYTYFKEEGILRRGRTLSKVMKKYKKDTNLRKLK